MKFKPAQKLFLAATVCSWASLPAMYVEKSSLTAADIEQRSHDLMYKISKVSDSKELSSILQSVDTRIDDEIASLLYTPIHALGGLDFCKDNRDVKKIVEDVLVLVQPSYHARERSCTGILAKIASMLHEDIADKKIAAIDIHAQKSVVNVMVDYAMKSALYALQESEEEVKPAIALSSISRMPHFVSFVARALWNKKK